ncbi:MAG: hypothetical protein HKN31_06555 [Pricia sp.]|nr:hypothetical protein [Pricia sp.]
MAGIKIRYEFQYLSAFEKGGVWWVKGKVNPDDEKPTKVSTADEAAEEKLLAVLEIILGAISTDKVLIPKSPEKKSVKLARSDISLNKKIVADLIDKASIPSVQKSALKAKAQGFVENAGKSNSEAQIYALLRQAQKVVNDLYDTQVALLPKDLETHHIDRVGENPSTFEKTKKNRIRRKLQNKIKSLPMTEQDRMANQSEDEQKQIMDLWVEQTYEQETENKADELLEEISLVILPMQIHRGAGETSVHGAERAEKKKEAALYTPEHSFDDFNSGEYD